MRTYDVVLVLAVGFWWFFFRKKYDWRAVGICYMAGVLLADVFCALIIVLTYHRHPAVIALPALLMPIGGIAGLAYGARKGKLDEFTRRLRGTES